jgi:thioredoxin reductase (NADPH)
VDDNLHWHNNNDPSVFFCGRPTSAIRPPARPAAFGPVRDCSLTSCLNDRQTRHASNFQDALMESLIVYLIAFVLILVTVIPYVLKMKKKERAAAEAVEKGKLMSGGPQAQHPHIDITKCIGCGTCVSACPEGDVLAVVSGKAMIVNGYKCVGHGLCAEACPVGAIEIVMASPSVSDDRPVLSEHYETNVAGVFIVGELGGMALIKNAVSQGRDCLAHIAERAASMPQADRGGAIVDVLIIGAGPAGISASLAAIQHKLSYVTLEQDDIGGTVRQYPRQKLVMTSPVELPLYGKFKKLEISKESLLELWSDVFAKTGVKVNTREKVLDVKCSGGFFTVQSSAAVYQAYHVVLALGRRGTPRKLGAPGEECDKVYYRLIEADHYKNCQVLVVGGGDSAVEAAMGLAVQQGNKVTLSYRGAEFTRIKDRNAKRLQQFQQEGRLDVLMQSNVVDIRSTEVDVEVGGERRTLPNDYLWVFAGGEAPTAFLQKIGIRIGAKTVTADTV